MIECLFLQAAHRLQIPAKWELLPKNITQRGCPVPKIPSNFSFNDNIINTTADPKNISLGKKVTLATYSMGRDDHGIEAIGFGFEPAA